MIYLFTALYCEAHVLIRQFALVKNPENTRFQEFYNESAGIRLTITGVGEIAAAMAVSSVCSVCQPKRNDLLLNIGTCARPSGDDGIFLCHKIIEQATGKTFYPDMLYCHGFREAAIVTGMVPWSGKEDRSAGSGKHVPTAPPVQMPAGALYDMEAAAVYQAGSCFFGPHQMIFLKAVSDDGTAKDVSAEQITRFMEKYGDRIATYIERLRGITDEYGRREDLPGQEDTALFEKLCADLHCSRAMRDSLRQYIRYLALTGEDYISAVQEMYREGSLPCKDKREGKLRFEAFKRRFF